MFSGTFLNSSELTLTRVSILLTLLVILNFVSSCSGGFFMKYGYNVQKGKVYYKLPFPDGTIEVEDVDVASFKVITRPADSIYADFTDFGTDKNAVFFKGHRIEGSDGPSFQILHINYAKDKNQCYHRGYVIPGADPASFRIKNDDYSVDRNNIFRREVSIDHDTTVFQTFPNSDIVHTANAVAIFGNIVPVPPGTSFRHLAHNYFALDNQVFFHDDSLPDSDAASFSALSDWFSKTKKHVYYGEKLIEDALPSSFAILVAPYGKDDNHIFFFEKKVAGADIKTFEILNEKFQCARDKHALYHEDKRVTEFTKQDLVNKNDCTNCNEQRVYFADSSVME